MRKFKKMSDIILITGDRKGIGRQLSEHFLEKNRIVIGCSRSGSDLIHKNYTHFICDVSNEMEVKRLFQQIRTKYKGIDVIVNNAGLASMNHILTTPTETFQKLNEINFGGTFLVTREGSKLMRKKGGSIINFTTVASPLNLEGEAIYASTKAAIEKFSKIAAFELSSYNIRINCIGPTPILTDLIRTVPKNKIEELIQKQSIKRLGKFSDVINVIEFFISPSSSFISGQTIYLGGV